MLRKRARLDGAEQGERAEGFVQRRRRWEGTKIPSQIVGSYCEAVMTIVPEWLAEQATKPPISYSYNTDNDGNISNNDGIIPKADTDEDSIEDGEEDTNRNGRIDGDNGDGIYQMGSEKWKETDPNSWDTDQDSIRDNIERDNGYNPLSNDTDNDGLNDTEEDTNRNGKLDSGETDPKLIDTDKDGLQDKLEVDGWTVCIRYEATGEEKTHYTVYSDPTDPDSDDDGLSDFDEYKNVTDPWKPDTDGDGKTDIEELKGDFNSSATGIDGEPPTIWKFECEYEIDFDKFLGIKIPSGLKVSIEVGVKDIFGIRSIAVFISGLPDRIYYFNNLTNVSGEIEWELKGIDEYKRAFFDGFKINLTATDRNGNIGFKTDELKSIAEIVVSAFLGALLAVAKFISELATGIFNWIYDSITSLFDFVLSKINEIIEYIYNFFQELLVNLLISLNPDGICNIIETLFPFINSPLIYILIGVDIIINVVSLLVNGIPIAGIIITIASFVISILAMIIMSSSDDDSGIMSIFSYIINKITDNREESTKNIWEQANTLSAQFGFLSTCFSGFALFVIFIEKICESVFGLEVKRSATMPLSKLGKFESLAERIANAFEKIPWFIKLLISFTIITLSFKNPINDENAGILPVLGALLLNIFGTFFALSGILQFLKSLSSGIVKAIGIITSVLDGALVLVAWGLLFTSNGFNNVLNRIKNGYISLIDLFKKDDVETVLISNLKENKINDLKIGNLLEGNYYIGLDIKYYRTIKEPYVENPYNKNKMIYAADENRLDEDQRHPDVTISGIYFNTKYKDSIYLGNVGNEFKEVNEVDFEGYFEIGYLPIKFSIYDDEINGYLLKDQERPETDKIYFNKESDFVTIYVKTDDKSVFIDTDGDGFIEDEEPLIKKLCLEDNKYYYYLSGLKNYNNIYGEIYFEIL